MKKLLHENKHHLRLILYVVVFVVCFALVIALLSGYGGGIKQKGTTLLPSLQNVNSVNFGLAVEEDQSSYLVGEEISILVNGSSNGAEITGYDVLFGFDPAAVEIVDVVSVREPMDIYPHQNPDYVSITGVKRITDESQVIFDNEDLVMVVVTLKKPGQTTFTIMPQNGNERSKMVNMNIDNIKKPILTNTHWKYLTISEGVVRTGQLWILKAVSSILAIFPVAFLISFIVGLVQVVGGALINRRSKYAYLPGVKYVTGSLLLGVINVYTIVVYVYVFYTASVDIALIAFLVSLSVIPKFLIDRLLLLKNHQNTK